MKFNVPRAKVYIPGKTKIKFPVVVEPKLDGWNLTVTKDKALSRGGNHYPILQYIVDDLRPYIGEWALNGEIMAHMREGDIEKYKSPWGKISTLLKTGMKRDWTLDWNKVGDNLEILKRDAYFIVYDVYPNTFPKTHDRRYIDRRSMYTHITQSVKYTSVVNHVIAMSHSALDTLHEQCRARGYEGSIIKSLGGVKLGKSNNIYKRKDWKDIDGTIIDIVEGKGKYADMAGAYTVKLENGDVINCNVLGDDLRVDHWKNKENIIGKPIEMREQDDKIKVGKSRNAQYVRIREDLC